MGLSCTDGGASGMCSCNKSRGYDELLQRYQQLEQVACELQAIAIITWKEARVLAGPQMKRSVERREEHLNRLKEQLEALGVSLDG